MRQTRDWYFTDWQQNLGGSDRLAQNGPLQWKAPLTSTRPPYLRGPADYTLVPAAQGGPTVGFEPQMLSSAPPEAVNTPANPPVNENPFFLD